MFSIDNELKSKMAAFTSSKTSLASLERKTGYVFRGVFHRNRVTNTLGIAVAR